MSNTSTTSKAINWRRLQHKVYIQEPLKFITFEQEKNRVDAKELNTNNIQLM